MKFIKHLGLIFFVIAFMQGCASQPSAQKQNAAQRGDEPVTLAAAGGSILPAGPVTPNPYLQSKPSVNNATAQAFAQATRAMRSKQWPQAEAALTQITAQHKNFSGAWLNLGLVYRAQGEDKRAEAAFTQAITANHLNVDAYNQLAILQREQGRFNDAEANYKKALTVWPFHAESHKNIGILYDLYLGKNAEALAHFEAYRQLRGDGDKQLLGWIADLQRRLGISPKPKAAPASVDDETPSAAEINEDPNDE